MPLTIRDIIQELDDVQRALIEECRTAKIARDNSAETLARAIRKANRRGISYGVLGQALGLSKESVWRQEHRTFGDKD